MLQPPPNVLVELVNNQQDLLRTIATQSRTLAAQGAASPPELLGTVWKMLRDTRKLAEELHNGVSTSPDQIATDIENIVYRLCSIAACSVTMGAVLAGTCRHVRAHMIKLKNNPQDKDEDKNLMRGLQIIQRMSAQLLETLDEYGLAEDKGFDEPELERV